MSSINDTIRRLQALHPDDPYHHVKREAIKLRDNDGLKYQPLQTLVTILATIHGARHQDIHIKADAAIKLGLPAPGLDILAEVSIRKAATRTWSHHILLIKKPLAISPPKSANLPPGSQVEIRIRRLIQVNPDNSYQEYKPTNIKAQAPPPFAIGSKTWPGIAKLQEEAAEVGQVIGKLIATGGVAKHWDGSDLIERLNEELGDLLAAIDFVTQHNQSLDVERIARRRDHKTDTFNEWHRQQTTKTLK